MKIKVIDLLVKIANNEKVPKKIKFDNKIWEKCINSDKYLGILNTYYTNEYNNLFIYIFSGDFNFWLNQNVEIIEEDKEIEKLDYKYVNTYGNVSQHRKSEEPLIDKINELIDEINKSKKND